MKIHFPNPTKTIASINDDDIFEVNSIVQSSQACKGPAIVLLALPRGTWSLRDRVLAILHAGTTRKTSSTSALLRAVKLESGIVRLPIGGSRMQAQSRRASYLVELSRTPKNQINP